MRPKYQAIKLNVEIRNQYFMKQQLYDASKTNFIGKNEYNILVTVLTEMEKKLGTKTENVFYVKIEDNSRLIYESKW